MTSSRRAASLVVLFGALTRPVAAQTEASVEQGVAAYPPWNKIDAWLAENGHGFAVAATDTQDWTGFEIEGRVLKGQRTGDSFSCVPGFPPEPAGTNPAPQEGSCYLGVLMTDDADGVEQLAVKYEGREIARLVGDRNTDEPRLFVVTQPVVLKAGTPLVFTCQSPVGCYRIHMLYFAREPIVPPAPAFEHVAAWSPEPGEIELCWTTTTAVETGVVEFGDGKTGPNPYVGRDHRARLSDLDPNQTYRTRIRTEYNGKPFVSDAIALLPHPPAPPATQPQSIEIAVEEPTSVPRHGWPATVGVPFTKGMLADATDLRLLTEDGIEQTLQARVFSRWPDGSVKWVVLDFLSDAPGRYRIEAWPRQGDPVESASDLLQVEEDADIYRFRTNTIAFNLTKKMPALFDRVGFDRDADGVVADAERVLGEPKGANLKIEPADRSFLTCGPLDPGGLEVETNGPVRAVLKWSGPMIGKDGPSGWEYLIRLTLWRGQPVLGLNVTVWFGCEKPPFSEIALLAMRLPLDAAGGVRGALDDRTIEIPPDEDGLWIQQDTERRSRMRTASGIVEGERAQGRVTVEDDRTRVVAVLRDFWQMYPSGFAIKPDGLHIRLLPPLAPETYESGEEASWRYRIHAWLKDGNYLFRAGQATQREFLVRYGATDETTDPAALAGWMNMPLLPHPAPEYLCATGVLGCPLFPRTEGVWNDYEALFDAGFEDSERDRKQRRTFGWMHYGDWFGERLLNYGNDEYDLGWAAGVQWMRTADRRLFERGLQMARHNSTVDTLHGEFAWASRGLVWEHCYNHVGANRTPEELGFPPDDGTANEYLRSFGRMLGGAMDPQGHVFQEGNWLYAALTGDRWLRDTAERVCIHQAEKLTRAFDFTIERSGGWPLINAVTAYKFSGDPYYLNAARLIVERCIERQDPATGGWLHQPPIGETANEPVLGGKAFAVGILSYGLLRYLDEEPEPRPDVRAMLVRGADWLMNESWNPGKGFRYISNAPNYRDTGARGITSLLNAELVAFAYEETHNVKYLDFWRDMMAGVLKDSATGMGKGFTQAVRQTVFGLDRVRQWNLTSLE